MESCFIQKWFEGSLQWNQAGFNKQFWGEIFKRFKKQLVGKKQEYLWEIAEGH